MPSVSAPLTKELILSALQGVSLPSLIHAQRLLHSCLYDDSPLIDTPSTTDAALDQVVMLLLSCKVMDFKVVLRRMIRESDASGQAVIKQGDKAALARLFLKTIKRDGSHRAAVESPFGAYNRGPASDADDVALAATNSSGGRHWWRLWLTYDEFNAYLLIVVIYAIAVVTVVYIFPNMASFNLLPVDPFSNNESGNGEWWMLPSRWIEGTWATTPWTIATTLLIVLAMVVVGGRVIGVVTSVSRRLNRAVIAFCKNE